MWASPPCTEYSRAMTSRRPRELPAADRLVASALACLLHLQPRYWFIENPEGHLQQRPLIMPLGPYLHKAAYCRLRPSTGRTPASGATWRICGWSDAVWRPRAALCESGAPIP